MSLFTGEFECKLDAKGRLVLPARLKACLPEVASNQIALMRGMDPCLVLYPIGEYRKIFSQIAALSEFKEENRVLQRNFFRRVSELELDNMGRLLIPKLMMQYAGLEKEVVVVGMGTRLEIWNMERYGQYLIDDNKEFSQLAQKHLNEWL
ncbi:MAG: division/cell wall cluster transcriptional repressor MraZ [Cyclobacteriaceae bacterium]